MFKLHSEYKPTGDQPQAIEKLVKGIEEGKKFQTLLGVTGSGKTFTMANIIAKTQKPTLVLAHNKTLAGQLYSEFKEFFPENNVEYFVSFYDFYQPEAYVPVSDTYIEKDAQINDEIDKLRHSATASLFETRNTIIVASVSCIYGLGDPIDYENMIISLRTGMIKDRNELLKKLIKLQYTRDDLSLKRGTFRARGDVVEVFPSTEGETGVIRISFWGDEIERMDQVNSVTGKVEGERKHVMIFPNSHYVTTDEKMQKAIGTIEEELKERVEYFKENNKLLEAQRIEERTNFDIEMMKETGFCQGIENYSRHISGRAPGSTPFTLFDYFPEDYLLLIDESHATIPQVRAMYNGDRARKETLVNYGFRLPSAFDNRPLKFHEFEERINQCIFVSATPGDYEKEHSQATVEQIIRPTGLLDPKIEVKPIDIQVDDLIEQINERTKKGERVLVTTLTKKMAEDLTGYLKNIDIKVQYMHSDIKTLQRSEIIRDLRLGKFDVLVGINLLREGLDIPEVSLVAILDADKEGFLRSERSLIQTIGRAARNTDGKVIMYADELTDSMEKAIKETNRRREIQEKYNKEHNITPKTINKAIRESIRATYQVAEDDAEYKIEKGETVEETINRLTQEMIKFADELDFENAAKIRDKIKELKA
ncbi:MAG: excinuclease ABC subunit UvrB [Clostridiales bacterium]|jgi:excinuclease ABC, B subunit|nr:excinuclease ABC subunit UvrB [Clostridiales bacterium]